EGLDATNPLWSSDGKRILFVGARPGELAAFYVKPVASGAAEEVLFRPSSPAVLDDWSVDGRFVLYETTDPKTGKDVGYLNLSGEHQPQALLATSANEAHARLSPDAHWIAYASDALGRPEVFVQQFPIGPSRWQLSTHGGVEPQWRRDG